MKILALCGSLRAASHNRLLLNVASRTLQDLGLEVDLAPASALRLPLYDQDLIDAEGFPPEADALRARLEAADGLLIASPEYNFSIAGPMKNALDWLSRYRPMPTRGRTGFIMSASPGAMGGIRGLWQLRIPLEGCGLLLHPDMFALAGSGKAFSEDGSLADPALAARLTSNLEAFADYTRRLRAP